jgi:NitT/TauT family transport system substrate-binding protein
MFAVLKGEKISVIATIQSSTKNEAIVARKDRGISKPADLRSKKVAVTFGTSGDFMLSSVLIVNRLSGENIRRVNLQPEELTAAVLTGRVDAAATWNPYVAQLAKALGDKATVFYSENVYTETFNIAALQDLVRKKPETVKRILKAVAKAEAFARNNPAEARALVAKLTGIDKQLTDELWGLNEFSVTLNQSLIIALEDEARWAIKNGLTSAKKVPNFLDYVYLDGLAAVKPEAVRIIR